jgi:hypothetical protein
MESRRWYLYLFASALQDQREQLGPPSVEMPDRFQAIAAFCEFSFPVDHDSKRDAVCGAQLSMETPPPSQAPVHPRTHLQPFGFRLRNAKHLVSFVENLPARISIVDLAQTGHAGKRQFFPRIAGVVRAVASSEDQRREHSHNYREGGFHHCPML